MWIAVLVAATAAGAILLIFFGLAGALGRDSAMDDRLGRYASLNAGEEMDEQAKRRARSSPLARRLERAVEKTTYAELTATKLARADLRLTVGEFVMAKIICALAGFALGLLFARDAGVVALLVGAAFALPGSFVPDIWVGMRARARIKKFNHQLGDTITLLSNSLRSGYSLLQSMELVARESQAPMAQEFMRVVYEVGLGISHQDAMSNLLRRVPSEDLDLLITAINIQHEVGGNLSQILDTIGHTIRERVRIKGEISVLTAQGQMSGYVITFIPIVLGGVLYVINPKYMSGILAWPWICMPIGAGVCVFLGYLAMRKIVTIEV
ncbi:MAG: type II secretion system F family protein [Chloroflexi bacterium]|nr:type II secretion system F family protein [Chloroflexota bacterium]